MFVLQLIHFTDIVHAPLTCRHTSRIVTETGEFFYMVLFKLYWHWYQRQGLSENNNLVPNNLGSYSNGKEGNKSPQKYEIMQTLITQNVYFLVSVRYRIKICVKLQNRQNCHVTIVYIGERVN